MLPIQVFPGQTLYIPLPWASWHRLQIGWLPTDASSSNTEELGGPSSISEGSDLRERLEGGLFTVSFHAQLVPLLCYPSHSFSSSLLSLGGSIHPCSHFMSSCIHHAFICQRCPCLKLPYRLILSTQSGRKPYRCFLSSCGRYYTG